MIKLDSVIFDLDGTLGDTMPVCYAAFRAAFEEFLGRRYSDAEIRAMFGPSEEGVIRRLVPDRWEDCLQAFYAAYEREHRQRATGFPGVETALRLLKGRGVRLGIVTGKGPGSLAISLRHLGLAGYFDACEPGSAAGAIKPVAIHKLLAAWGVAPQHAAYVGDLPYDVRAAKEAGVVPLAAAWAPGSDAAALAAAGPQEVFATVEAFVQWIGDRFGA